MEVQRATTPWVPTPRPQGVTKRVLPVLGVGDPLQRLLGQAASAEV